MYCFRILMGFDLIHVHAILFIILNRQYITTDLFLMLYDIFVGF